jgi:hypothetical protein
VKPDVREENLNVMLAELLAERGLRALGEVRLSKKQAGRAQPDVLIDLNGVRIVIEGKWVGQREQLSKQGKSRVEESICDICIMVEYIDLPIKNNQDLYDTQVDIKSALLQARFNVGLLSYVDLVAAPPRLPEWYEGVGFGEILRDILDCYSRLVREDVLAPIIDRMRTTLYQFASATSSKVDLKRIKEVLETKGEKSVSGRSKKEEALKLLATTGLLLLDAMVFQESLARIPSDIIGLSELVEKGKKGRASIKRTLAHTWQEIVEKIDYEPVFCLSLDLINKLPHSPTTEREILSLVELGRDIASSRALLRHDFFGRIYHRLLLGELVKYYATYYTSIPAARLLATLLLNLPPAVEIKPDSTDSEPIRVVDFACGSGTLLSAIYKEADANYRLKCPEPSPEQFHKYLVEQVIWGFDVLHHAIHLAATTLSMHNIAPVNKSNLFVVKLGKGALGSIAFLKDRDVTAARIPWASIDRVAVTGQAPDKIVLPDFDICIMNPPFTRSVGGNLLFGSLPQKERAELQKVLSDLLRQKSLSGIGQAGLGAVFFFIADTYLKENGRIGLVLPRSVLSGVAWEKVREKLLKDYLVEFVITSYQTPNGWNFSENTSLSEVLLIARKAPEEERKKSFTLFVNLTRKPTSEIEATSLGRELIAVRDSARLYNVENSNAALFVLRTHGERFGEVYAAKLENTNFGQYNFFSSMELNRAALILKHGLIYLPEKGVVAKIPVTNLASLDLTIGPDRRQVHTTFANTSPNDRSIYKAFWGYESEKMRKITQSPNASLEPKADKKQANDLWEKRGNLLIVERSRLSTYTVLSVFVDEAVLSNVWWPIATDEETAKIISLWVNSTFGLFSLACLGEVTEGPWVSFKKESLSSLVVPDIGQMSTGSKKSLLQLYAEVKESEFKPLPEEFAAPDVKRKIDEGICAAFGIKNCNLDTLYHLLSKEPMITGR